MVYLITILLVSLSALFSGLTLGLMSLGPHELKRKVNLGDKKALKIYKVRKKGNQLLVTLLVGNVAVNATLSIFLGSIAPGLVAGLISITLITIFGEIAPQAVFSRFAIELGSRVAWLVQIVMILLYPISKPLAWILDKILGEELPTVYSKKELVQMLEEHKDSGESDVRSDEERIARGALTFGEKEISKVMTPRSMVVSIEENDALNDKKIKELVNTGVSRVPVYKDNIDNVTGILYMHDVLSLKKGSKAGEVAEKKVYYVNEKENLDHALNALIKTKRHLFIVINNFSEVVGIISVEDVIEEILGKEIVDEFDKYDNVRAVAEKTAKQKVKTS